MKLKMYQDKYLCFGIIFNHAKFLKKEKAIQKNKLLNEEAKKYSQTLTT